MSDFITTTPATSGSGTIMLEGDWTLATLKQLIVEAQKIEAPQVRVLQAQIGQMDMAGAMALTTLADKIGVPAEQVNGLHPEHIALLQLIKKDQATDMKPVVQDDTLTRWVSSVGRTASNMWSDILDLISFLGEATVTLIKVLAQPQRLRFASINRHIRETGLNAIPIVALIAFLISIVLAYQGANQLKRFGAEIFAINMIAISVLREMGVLLTAIMVAGRSGSAFTAEIGVMKVNEEVDAMQIIGVKPFEILVIPRILALIITLPLLTFIADLMGLLGGGLISFFQMHISPEQYLNRFRGAVELNDFFVGMVKAPVFAFFIALVGCMRGLQVSGSAESVGRLTTVSVVQSIFLVLLLDALFSILFTKLGI